MSRVKHLQPTGCVSLFPQRLKLFLVLCVTLNCARVESGPALSCLKGTAQVFNSTHTNILKCGRCYPELQNI